MIAAACRSAEVTHAHPLAQQGASLIACATAFAYRGVDNATLISRLCGMSLAPALLGKLSVVSGWLADDADIKPRQAAQTLGNGISALDSCVSAIYIALRFRSLGFDALLAYSISMRGDTDTISAMAGAIWGAANGLYALPEIRLASVECIADIQRVAQAFCTAVIEAECSPPSIVCVAVPAEAGYEPDIF